MSFITSPLESNLTIKVNASGALNGSTMTVRVRATRTWLLRVRIQIGLLFVRLGAAIMGVGEFRVEGHESNEG